MIDVAADRVALRRLCDRLRSATEARLARPDQRLSGASVVEAVHLTAAWAAASQGLPSEVPRLHPLASGDQLAVIGRGLLDWVSAESARNPESEPELVLMQWRERIERLRAAI